MIPDEVGFDLFGGVENIVGDRLELEIAGGVEIPVDDPVALLLEVFGEVAHGEEETGDLLEVVAGVVRFRPGFEETISDVLVRLGEPGVVLVELVSENEA